MKKADAVAKILGDRYLQLPRQHKAEAFAPVNIALCKYWGKRNIELNLPQTGSLSITLPDRGCTTCLTLIDSEEDRIVLNGEPLTHDSAFVRRCVKYLDLYRAPSTWHLQIDIESNIPVAAGFASSASGFASLVLALDQLFAWELPRQQLSILARLGSGSASRSLWNGFVEWYAGQREDGMDSFAEPIQAAWPDLMVGLVPVSNTAKPVSSRNAMLHTAKTSVLYQSWPDQVAKDLKILHDAIQSQDFDMLGACAEANALAMHATMLATKPAVCYMLPKTIEVMQQVWRARQDGLKLYFTQDAGPNIKLIVHKRNISQLREVIPEVELVNLF